jgi:Arc/MetJ family transcription regulator
MRTTLVIDDGLLASARTLTGLHQTSALVHTALTLLVEREIARRLARMGGTEPDLKPIRRRRRRS